MRSKQSTLSILATFVAVGAFVVASNAAVITNGPTQPTVDGDDIANLATPNGTQKWFSGVEELAGQTLTPPTDLYLDTFSVHLSSPNQNDADPNEWVLLRLGTITRPGGVFTFTDIYSEPAYVTSDWAAEDWVTFTFDTPQLLTGGVEYGIITAAQNFGDWHKGIPYRYRTPNSEYPGGQMINRGNGNNADLVFIAQMSAGEVPEPASLALIGLGGLMILRRRR